MMKVKPEKDMQLKNFIPAKEGYRFPAEWEPHEATWLSWPHNKDSWPGKIETIYPVYAEFVKLLAECEKVNINVNDEGMMREATRLLMKAGTDMNQVHFYLHPTNDAWCRDHGPAFVVNPVKAEKKIILNWGYNAWGEKYPPYNDDNLIPEKAANVLNIPYVTPGIIMEGGSVEFNGRGTLLTTKACLLNPNRNKGLSQETIEEYLHNYYGVNHILWLGDGIEGDDTDGHVDDLTRFVNEDTVVTVVEENKNDANYKPLQENVELLHKMKLQDGRPLKVVELPMPDPVIYEDTRLPASYANFYIANKIVVVPTFRCAQDQKALNIMSGLFPHRKIVGLDAVDMVWGLGTFHCLSQQEPKV